MKVKAFFLCADVRGSKKFPTLVDCAIINVPMPSFPCEINLKIFAMVANEPAGFLGRHLAKIVFIEDSRMSDLGEMEFFLPTDEAVELCVSDIKLKFEGPTRGRIVATFEPSGVVVDWPLRVRSQEGRPERGTP